MPMRNSDLLSDCLVDSDEDATRRAQQRRRKALTISLAVEFLLVAALLAGPLLNPSTMSARYAVVPIPPYGGTPSPGTSHPIRHPIGHPIIPGPTILYRPGIQPPHPAAYGGASDDGPPDTGVGVGGCEGCLPGRPGVPGGSENGPPVPRPPEPRPPVASKPVFVSQGAQEAMLIRRVEPLYPTIARQIHLSGTVELRAIIAKDGGVIDLEVVSGNPILARAAVEAVRQWRYRPTRLNNQPIEVQTFITVKFVLE
jgi:periplasmic protein TonB